MKKAKNAFAIIAIVLGVVAALCVVGLPVLESILIGKPYNEAFASIPFVAMKDNFLALVKFDWFADLGANLINLVGLAVGGIGLILFVVLLVLMLCKKHAKGLGWWIPMLIVFALTVFVVVGCKLNFAGYEAQTEEMKPFLAIIGSAVCYVAIAAGVLMILSLIFYMGYVCKSSAQKKQAAKELADTKEELHNAIREALGK